MPGGGPPGFAEGMGVAGDVCRSRVRPHPPSLLRAMPSMPSPQRSCPQWVLRRACRLSPAQLAVGCALPCGVGLLLGLGFALAGYPWIVVFALIELAAVAFAYCRHAQHVGDQEVLTLEPGGLRVQQRCGAEVRELVLQPQWLRVQRQPGGTGLIELRAGHQCVQVGCHLPAAERVRFERELTASLRALASPPAAHTFAAGGL